MPGPQLWMGSARRTCPRALSSRTCVWSTVRTQVGGTNLPGVSLQALHRAELLFEEYLGIRWKRWGDEIWGRRSSICKTQRFETAWTVQPKLASLSYSLTQNPLQRLLYSHQNEIPWHLRRPSPPPWKDCPPHLYANSCLYFTYLLSPQIPCPAPSLEFAHIVVCTQLPFHQLILTLLICHSQVRSYLFLLYLAHHVLSFLWTPTALSHPALNHIRLCITS